MTPEREIKVTLLNGNILTMNTEERVIACQLSEDFIPVVVDAEGFFDEVMEALAEAQQTIARQREAMGQGWISVDEKLPETQARVLVSFLNESGKRWTTCAEYIAPKTVLEEDYMDEQYTDGGEYDEDKDCYWTTSGWYESNYEPETNWRLNCKVTHWMPLPALGEGAKES
ncbi:DUF551 domain-containing protein [Paenibacillus typhae]|uniref:DUF551 domain-containing protein n=1 Tax=Paenibacillus typhae TaxID=1174501 RepID=UPI001C8D1D41|nr:DUF551 domain-containing protein [Paenibacillus typhae]MBY0011477.1 DUF551 domain-containing protein [Paenibacillus typhae]